MHSRNDDTPLKVGISGSYGGFNLGDEAILHVILNELRRSAPIEITVFSRDAEETRRRHRVERVLELRTTPRREAQALLDNLDLFILGGGGLLYDGDADMYLREVGFAQDVGTPVMTYAISAGPLIDPGVRSRVRDALNRAAVITVRDRHTWQLFEEIGVEQEVVLTADPAVLLQAEPLTLDEILRAEAIDPHARLIGFSVREPGPAAPDLDVEHYHRLLANTADFLIERLDAEVVFFPLERRTFDVQHSHAVVGRMNHAQRATVLKRDYTPGQILSLLEHFEFCVGMRLHFLIFSAIAGVPFMALPYATKVKAFVDEMHLPATPTLDHISAGGLIAHVDRAWDQRDELRSHIQIGLRELQTRARAGSELAQRLLTQTKGTGNASQGAR
jgi:polysaccharide pyruvyl transferase CsaB